MNQPFFVYTMGNNFYFKENKTMILSVQLEKKEFKYTAIHIMNIDPRKMIIIVENWLELEIPAVIKFNVGTLSAALLLLSTKRLLHVTEAPA